MAITVRRYHLAGMICLALLVFPTIGQHPSTSSSAAASQYDHRHAAPASDTPPTAARGVASSHHLPPSTTSTSTLPDDAKTHNSFVASSFISGMGATGGSPPPQAPQVAARAVASDPRSTSAVHKRAVAVDSVASTPRGITATAKTKVLPLPLLVAVPFLPRPVAALVALTSLAAPVHAIYEDCFRLNHATCSVYNYDNETDAIDRTSPPKNPDTNLRSMCLHPLCHADNLYRLFSVLYGRHHGRDEDPLRIYCTVRTLEGPLSILPWRNTWRVHLPVADPVAAAASGGNICYVELEHLDYREGYYIHCPAGEHREAYCTEFPEKEVAAAVWEHRRLNYHATVGKRYGSSNNDEL